MKSLPFLSAPPPITARERRARRATECVLTLALVASLVACLLRESEPSPSLAFHDIAVDVARDPPWRLRLLPAIGPARANAILADREANGPLPSLHDLSRVRGFGAKTVASLARAGATVAPSPAAFPAAPPAPLPPPDPREHSPPRPRP